MSLGSERKKSVKMSSLVVHAVGNIGRAAETRSAGSTTVTSFSVACNRKEKSAGAMVEAVEWLNVSIWGERGAKLSQYLAKGKKVAVYGELTTRQYEKDGKNRTSLELRADGVTFCDSKKEGDDDGPRRDVAAPSQQDDGEIPF